MALRFNFKRELHQVLFERDGAVKKVILNRPKKLNSLSYEMISQMITNFEAFENDPTTRLVILKGNGRAFCAGGDVVGNITAAGCRSLEFWSKILHETVYLGLPASYIQEAVGKTNLRMVSLLDGLVMGGGVGISVNAKFKIVTENTVFAMPEASIGLFPDVGASYFLSRLPGSFGEFLGLTGARLNGADMIACSLATHYVLSKDLPLLENALQTLVSFDIDAIEGVISNFGKKSAITDDSPFNRLSTINKCFSKDTVEEILTSLENEAKNKSEMWITTAMNSMKSSSPISLKIFLKSIREGRMQNLRDCIIREYTISCNVIRASASNDFYEGSRAMLFDKDNRPKWEPSKLELVSEDMVDVYFSGIDEDEWEYLQLPVREVKTEILRPRL